MNKHCGTCNAFETNLQLTKELREVKDERDDWRRRYHELEETIGSISVEPTGEKA
jgi:hypothetical protein